MAKTTGWSDLINFDVLKGIEEDCEKYDITDLEYFDICELKEICGISFDASVAAYKSLMHED